MTSERLSVTFWGVRGSIPCPGPTTVRYGGNTPCLEVRAADRLMIFDAGTGLLPLGRALAAPGTPIEADWYFTHTHFDHIQGIPFFSPFYDKNNRFRLWASHLAPEMNLKDVLSNMMQAPLFPIPIEIFGAAVSYTDFPLGKTLNPAPGITIRTAALNHPNRATGYRVEVAGQVALLRHRHRTRAGQARCEHPRPDQGCPISSSMTAPIPMPSFPAMSAGAIRRGRKACAS